MKSSVDIMSNVKTILETKWTKRDGRKVPDAVDLKLGNDAVILDGTILYSDMSDSTGLVNGHKDWFAAEVYKSYLSAACHIIENNSGVITAFDGDRVMAVYIGDYKNSSAAKTALQINFITDEINAEIKRVYPNTSYVLQHSIGIDTSSLFISRTGIRASNDLVWVGRSANYAAKLCSLGGSNYSIFITKEVFNKLSNEVKIGGNPPRSMWQKNIWKEMGIVIYQSGWTWSF